MSIFGGNKITEASLDASRREATQRHDRLYARVIQLEKHLFALYEHLGVEAYENSGIRIVKKGME